MPVNKDIGSLQPNTARKCRLFVQKCEEAGIPVAVTETTRDLTTHLLYYLQGRLDIKNNALIVNEYNALRKKHGLWEDSVQEALFKQITWSLNSNHFSGKAFDCVPLENGKPWWTASDEVWNKMGEIAKECELSWGGYWPEPKKDKPHFEDLGI